MVESGAPIDPILDVIPLYPIQAVKNDLKVKQLGILFEKKSFWSFLNFTEVDTFILIFHQNEQVFFSLKPRLKVCN